MNILLVMTSILIVACGIKAGINLRKKKEVEGILWLVVMWLILIFSAVLAE